MTKPSRNDSDRSQRLAAELRANLAKRKALKRKRTADPAKSSPESAQNTHDSGQLSGYNTNSQSNRSDPDD